MSVYKPKNSPFYHFDFQINGRTFHGSTKVRNKREVEQVERDLREKAKAEIELAKRLGGAPMTFDLAAGRYWEERGQHHRNH